MALLAGAAVALAGCGRSEPPLGQRAMDAYKKGDYKAALPLLKMWAATPEVAKDPQRRADVLAYIVDAELKTSGKAEGVSLPAMPGPAPAPATPAPATAAPAVPAVAVPAIPAGPPNLAALRAQAAAVASQMNAGPPSLADRIPHKPIAPGEIRAMTIKELGNFPFDPLKDKDVPADVKALSGSKVRLRGFMIPMTQAERITDFALVPSLVSCCFGQPPGVQHTITCRIPKSKELEFVTDEVWVEGTLKVNVIREDGYSNSVFELAVTSVKLVE